MKLKSVFLLFLFLFLTGCMTFGSRVLYHDDNGLKNSFKKIGVLFPRMPGYTERVLTNSAKVVNQTLRSFAKKEKNFHLIYFPEDTTWHFETPDTLWISQKCSTNELDGLILMRVRFTKMIYTVYFVPVSQNFDAQVEAKLYDRHGRLVVHVYFDTYFGNSYWLPPSAQTTLHDGLTGALKRLLKELNRG